MQAVFEKKVKKNIQAQKKQALGIECLPAIERKGKPGGKL